MAISHSPKPKKYLNLTLKHDKTLHFILDFLKLNCQAYIYT